MTSTKQRLKAKNDVKAQEGDMPVIAWEEMSILDTLALTSRQDESTYINVISAKIQAGVATKADWERLDYLRSSEYQAGVINQQAEDMAKFVTYVPQHWFKKSAPEGLDFDSPETFKLLQPKRFIQVYQMLLMNDAQAEASTGN